MTVSNSTISGNSAGLNGGGIEARDVTVRDSTVSGNSGREGGGGISVMWGNVTVSNSTIADNTAVGGGGGMTTLGSGPYGNVTVNDSTISGNSAGSGGGIFCTNQGYGYASGNVTVSNSTISGNSAGDSGGGIGTVGYLGGNVTVSNSTISGNSAAGGVGGGITTVEGKVAVNSSTMSGNSAGAGGGIFTHYVTVSNSTISGNSARGDGGGINGYGHGNVTVSNSTISGNSAAGAGGGIFGSNVAVAVDVANSIVAGNTGGSRSDVSADTISALGSLIGDHSGTGLAEALTPDDNGNLIGSAASPIDPRLGPLQDNGGPTVSHALLPGSPAINNGEPSFQDPPDHDQRGALFVRVSGGRIDMGAFESQVVAVDFNDDNLLDCDDIDALMAAIVDGNNPPAFDLTGDTHVGQTDLDVWLSLAGQENLPSHQAYLPGDANLDGRVDGQDLNVVGRNWRQNVTSWCSGEFTADGVIDARDLNELGLNWQHDLPDEAATARQRAPKAALAQNVAVTTTGRLDSDGSLQSANQIIERIQTEHVRQIAEETLDQVLRHRSRRIAISSESRRSLVHDERREFAMNDQLVDSVLENW